MPRRFTGVVILTRSKEELKEALEAAIAASESREPPEPPGNELQLVSPRRRVA